MTCMNCNWWRPREGTPTDDDGIPAYGRCVALPPSPAIMAVRDREEWNRKEMVVVWPQTLPHDLCAAMIPRAMVDQDTGRWKMPNVAVDEDEDTLPN